MVSRNMYKYNHIDHQRGLSKQKKAKGVDIARLIKSIGFKGVKSWKSQHLKNDQWYNFLPQEMHKIF